MLRSITIEANTLDLLLHYEANFLLIAILTFIMIIIGMIKSINNKDPLIFITCWIHFIYFVGSIIVCCNTMTSTFKINTMWHNILFFLCIYNFIVIAILLSREDFKYFYIYINTYLYAQSFVMINNSITKLNTRKTTQNNNTKLFADLYIKIVKVVNELNKKNEGHFKKFVSDLKQIEIDNMMEQNTLTPNTLNTLNTINEETKEEEEEEEEEDDDEEGSDNNV